jgi:DNA-binding response OmpR family regulator
MGAQKGIWIMTRILLIDDEEPIGIVFKDILQRAGYEVEAAADGAQGIIVQRENSADIIITDVVMPGMIGLKTILELRRTFPAVPIIAISGGGQIASGEYLSLATRFGAACTLMKPISAQELIAAVTSILDTDRVFPTELLHHSSKK